MRKWLVFREGQNSWAVIEFIRASSKGFVCPFSIPLHPPCATGKIWSNITEADDELLVPELCQACPSTSRDARHFALLSWRCGWALLGPGRGKAASMKTSARHEFKGGEGVGR